MPIPIDPVNKGNIKVGTLKIDRIKEDDFVQRLIDGFEEFFPKKDSEGYPHTLLQIITALGESQDPRATAPLLKALKAKDDILIYAINALGWRKDKEAILPLIEILNNNKDIDFQCCVVDSLGKIGGEEAEKVLINIALNRSTIDLRCAAIDGLGYIETQQSKETLTKLLNDSDIDIRSEAKIVLALCHSVK